MLTHDLAAELGVHLEPILGEIGSTTNARPAIRDRPRNFVCECGSESENYRSGAKLSNPETKS